MEDIVDRCDIRRDIADRPESAAAGLWCIAVQAKNGKQPVAEELIGLSACSGDGSTDCIHEISDRENRIEWQSPCSKLRGVTHIDDQYGNKALKAADMRRMPGQFACRERGG